MVTHQGLARHLQSLFSKEEGVLSVDLHKGRTLGSIGTTEFSDLEEQGKLVILCAVEHAERLYAFAYEKLELSTKSNGLLYSQTVAASALPGSKKPFRRTARAKWQWKLRMSSTLDN